jgi:uncharacterized lipoprotein YmbA
MKTGILVCLLILVGCASAPPTQFYSLGTPYNSPVIQNTANLKPLIGVAQVSLPKYD